MKRGLGRGLDALLPPASDTRREVYREIAVEGLVPNAAQPRTSIDDGELASLAASIAARGVIEPIVVRPRGSGFEIVAGERRWRAARQAGLARVPVVIREVADDDIGLLALIENLQREELNPLEEAAAFRKLAHAGRTHEQIAIEVGRSRTAITNTLRLLELTPPVATLVAKTQLSTGAARALLPLPAAEQLALAREIVRRQLPVREVERRVAVFLGRKPHRPPRRPDPNTRDAQHRMERAMGLPVRLDRRGKGGTVTVRFFNEDDLHRVFQRLTGDSDSRSRTP